ncbi:hypothetical protein MXB_2096, partial [Myxobolus squamalis]
EHENDEHYASNISATNPNPSKSGTFLILTLLLIPFSMGEKISLFSRDQYVRLYFPDAYAGGTRIPDIIWGFTNAMFPVGGGIGSSMNAGLCYFFDLLPPSYVPFCQPMIQLSLIFGLTLSSIFSLDQITQQHWIITSIPLAVTHVILITTLVFLPESPNYLYEKTSNYEKTKKISADQNNENAEVKLISTVGFLSDKSLTSSIIVMTAIQLFQQYSGINAVIYYANDFLIKSKFNYEDIGVSKNYDSYGILWHVDIFLWCLYSLGLKSTSGPGEHFNEYY